VTEKPAGWGGEEGRGGVANKETFLLNRSHHDSSSSHNVSI